MRQWLNEVYLDGCDWMLSCDDGTFPQMAAQVPGNIQADAVRARQLTPIYYGLGDERIWEIARHDWLYEKTFTLDPAWQGKRVNLCFDGVDYDCEVLLNGKVLGGNAGMYIAFQFDITDCIIPGQPQRLGVRIRKMPPELEEWLVKSDGPGSGEGTDYHFVLGMDRTRQVLKGMKSITNFSYDWGTNIWTLGIWKSVRLLASDGAFIRHNFVHSEPDEDGGHANLRAEWVIDCQEDCDAVMEVEIARPNGRPIARKAPLLLKRGEHSYVWKCTIDKPELWWPNKQGGQPLYLLHSRLLSERGVQMDGLSVRFGIRKLEWTQVDGLPADFPNPVRCVINGRPIRLIGSDINSTDLLHGEGHAKGRTLVRRAHQANFNTIRMNGGAIIFTEDFYDACDELGILQLAEFPLGNCVPETTREFLAHWERVVASVVGQLRNHPSIIEWSGGNEMGWRIEHPHPALRVAQKMCALDDGRIFRATSPAEGVRHAPWDYNPLLHYSHYNSEVMRDQTGQWPMLRNCEFGAQTPANLETFLRTMPPQNRFPVRLDDPVQTRKNTIGASFNAQVWLMPEYIRFLFGEPDTLADLIDAGQWMGFEGLRYAFDALRDRGPSMAGMTSWCLGEPWFNGAGSFMVEFDGQPVPMFYGARQAAQPLSLHLRYDSLLYDMIEGTDARIMLSSDVPEWVRELRWQAVLRDRRGVVYRAESGTTEISCQEVKCLGHLRIQPPTDVLAGPVLCELTLYNGQGRCIGERLYVFGAKGALHPLRGLLRRDTPDVPFGQPQTYTGIMGGPLLQTTLEVTAQAAKAEDGREAVAVTFVNKGAMTAVCVMLHPLLDYRTDLFIDGQYGFIPPGESRTLVVHADVTELPLMQTGWRATAFNAPDALCQPEGALLWAGRRDDTTTGFAGCDAPIEALSPQALTASGCMLPAAQMHCLLSEQVTLTFQVSPSDAQKPCTLDLFTSDRDQQGADLHIALNAAQVNAHLPGGYGIQRQAPWHWAAPHHLRIAFEAGALQAGTNCLTLTLPHGAWLTFDALRLCRHLTPAERRLPRPATRETRVSWGANFL